MNQEIKTLDLREHKGRVFFSTDLHGHFDLLHEKLKEVAFDSTKDILVLGGDCTDRGPDSKYILDYLNEPWIYSIRGNHEQMVIDFIEALSSGDERNARQPFQMLYCNGGDVEILGNTWYTDLGSFFRDKISFTQLM